MISCDDAPDLDGARKEIYRDFGLVRYFCENGTTFRDWSSYKQIYCPCGRYSWYYYLKDLGSCTNHTTYEAELPPLQSTTEIIPTTETTETMITTETTENMFTTETTETTITTETTEDTTDGDYQSSTVIGDRVSSSAEDTTTVHIIYSSDDYGTSTTKMSISSETSTLEKSTLERSTLETYPSTVVEQSTNEQTTELTIEQTTVSHVIPQGDDSCSK